MPSSTARIMAICSLKAAEDYESFRSEVIVEESDS